MVTLLGAGSPARADDGTFAAKPTAAKAGDRVKISFALSAPTDVEVAVVSADGKVVRHLAAGMLGGKNPPPEPLKAGLSQALEWDGRDDFGKPAAGGPFKVRVRAGIGAKFGRFIGEDPCNFGSLESVAGDEDGNVYIAGARGDVNQTAMCLRVFDPEGRYRREVVPFPADLPPDAMKEIARWDGETRSWHPRNRRNLNPDFYGQPGGYWANPALTLISASRTGGITLTDGATVARLDVSGAVPGPAFRTGELWPKNGRLPNSGGGPLHLATSKDGKYLYLSGPFSAGTYTGYVYDPRFPPGQVYRMEVGKGTMEPFVKLPVHKIKMPPYYDGKQPLPSPLAGVAVDPEGNVLVADRDAGRVAVFDPSGRELGAVPIAHPDVLAVHPRTGAVYVLTQESLEYRKIKKTLVTFSGWKDARRRALLDLGTDAASMPRMALAAGEKSTVVWVTGLPGGLKSFEDKGAVLEPLKNRFAARTDVPRDWGRLAVDYERDEIYVSNYCVNFWRYNGQTGEGGALLKDGKPFYGTDLAVGYDGLLYVRTGNSFSGPLERLTRDLQPAPYAATGTHVLSPYIYSRMGNGMAERGLGVGPDGKVYISFMYRWVAYAIGGWGPDGKPLNGKYLEGTFPGGTKYPAELKAAVIGPIPQGNANIRVDLKGDLYVGLMHRPKDFVPPKGFEKDQGYRVSVGSVVRFGPEGGTMPGKDDAVAAPHLEGIKQVYPGLAPFSSAAEGFGNNTCCVCRVPRFDLDRYGRLILPNAMTNSVRVYDNAGNLLLEFGKYGNFDSLFVNPNTEAGRAGKPAVAGPEIPLAWPTCAGFSERAIYVLDTYTRRVVRMDPTWKAEETCAAGR
jgi:sugar lactone lactonase YvrE